MIFLYILQFSFNDFFYHSIVSKLINFYAMHSCIFYCIEKAVLKYQSLFFRPAQISVFLLRFHCLHIATSMWGKCSCPFVHSNFQCSHLPAHMFIQSFSPDSSKDDPNIEIAGHVSQRENTAHRKLLAKFGNQNILWKPEMWFIQTPQATQLSNHQRRSSFRISAKYLFLFSVIITSTSINTLSDHAAWWLHISPCHNGQRVPPATGHKIGLP